MVVPVVEVVASNTFSGWLSHLPDVRGQAIIARRIERLAGGNPGDVKPVGAGVSELRIPFGPGYRVYFMNRSGTLIVLLAGGDKSTQATDIVRAKMIAKSWD